MAQITKWVVWANAALDPILFLENERGQVIGTRLTQNPKGIQVFVCVKKLYKHTNNGIAIYFMTF